MTPTTHPAAHAIDTKAARKGTMRAHRQRPLQPHTPWRPLRAANAWRMPPHELTWQAQGGTLRAAQAQPSSAAHREGGRRLLAMLLLRLAQWLQLLQLLLLLVMTQGWLRALQQQLQLMSGWYLCCAPWRAIR